MLVYTFSDDIIRFHFNDQNKESTHTTPRTHHERSAKGGHLEPCGTHGDLK